MEGKERADWSALRQFLLLDEGWSHAGWRALEATCSPEDLSHLEVTHGQNLVRVILWKLHMPIKPFHNIMLYSLQEECHIIHEENWTSCYNVCLAQF